MANSPIQNVLVFSRDDLYLLMLISDLVRFDQFGFDYVNCYSAQPRYKSEMSTLTDPDWININKDKSDFFLFFIPVFLLLAAFVLIRWAKCLTPTFCLPDFPLCWERHYLTVIFLVSTFNLDHALDLGLVNTKKECLVVSQAVCDMLQPVRNCLPN